MMPTKKRKAITINVQDDSFPQDEPLLEIRLPYNWVYVQYADGTMQNVANQDRLTESEATSYAKRWEESRKKRVTNVYLLDGAGRILEAYRATRKGVIDREATSGKA